MMQPIAGGALARPFVTHHNALDMPLYMRIAPELYLKRLTVGGIERVFEINRNFRNEGISTQHNPEFTMLEFYWAYADYNDLMTLTEEMLAEVARKARRAATEVTFGEHAISFTAPFRRLSLREAARDGGGAAARRRRSTPAICARARRRRRWRRGSASTVDAGDGRRARSRRRSSRRCARTTSSSRPSSTTFPTEVSPLSKQKPDDPDTVERFELYIGGFEVANAFSELNDPAEQRRRFEEQLRQPRRRRRRSARDGRGLHPRARVRHAAGRRAKASASIGW